MDFQTFMAEAEARWHAQYGIQAPSIDSGTSTQTTSTLSPDLQRPKNIPAKKSTPFIQERVYPQLSGEEDTTPSLESAEQPRNRKLETTRITSDQSSDKRSREGHADFDSDMEPAKLPPTKQTGGQAKSSRRILGYKDRKAITRRMRLDPSHKDVRVQVRERRDFIKMQCIRRNYPLEKPFEEFQSDVMYKLVRNVAFEMQAQYGAWWDQELTRDVIHAICLDKVRNTKAKTRPKGAYIVKKTDTHGNPDIGDVTKLPALTQNNNRANRTVLSEDSNIVGWQLNHKQKPPGTTHQQAPPPPIKPINSAKMGNLGTPASALALSRGSQASPPDPVSSAADLPSSPPTRFVPRHGLYEDPSPLAGRVLRDIAPTPDIPESQFDRIPESQFDSFPESQFNGIPESQFDRIPESQFDSFPESQFNGIPESQFNGIPESQFDRISESQFDRIPESQFDRIPESQFGRVQSNYKICESQPSKTPGPSPTVTVYIKGHSPFYIPYDSGYQVFEAAVAQRLKWGEDKFLLYRASRGGKAERTWVTIGRDIDWYTLVKKYGEVGVFVKVVEDSWFNSEGEEEPNHGIDTEANEYKQEQNNIAAPTAAQQVYGAGRKNQPIPPVLNAPQPKPKTKSRQKKQPAPDIAQGAQGVQEKRKRGRPHKNPLPTTAIQETSEIPSSSVVTKCGRAVHKSEKASQELSIQAEKRVTDQVALARERIKKLKKEFTI